MRVVGFGKHPALVGKYDLRGEQVAWGLGQDLFDEGAGGFETDIGSWGAQGSNTREVSTDKAHGGVQSLKVTYVDSTTGAILYFRDSYDLFTDLTVGKKYRITLWAAINTGSCTLEVYSGAGSEVTMATISNTSMQRFVYDFIADSATGAYIRMGGMGAGESIYIDDISIQEIEEGDLFDLTKGGFETGTGAWTVYGTNTIEASTDIAHSGSQSLKVVYVDNVQGAYLYFSAASDLFTNLTVGKKYRIKGWAAVGSGDSVDIHNNNGASQPKIITVTSETMVPFSHDFISAHATDVHLRFANMGAGEIFYLDDITLQEVYTPDMSGRANHGTVNGATATPWGYSFTTDDYITLAGESDLRFDGGAQDFTIMAWVKRDAVGANHMIIDKRDANNDGWMLLILGGANNVSFSVNTVDAISPSASLADTDWHHIIGVAHRSGNADVYIDNIWQVAADISGQTLATTVSPTMGKDAYAASNYMNGTIRDLKIFSVALNHRERQEEMRRSRQHLILAA